MAESKLAVFAVLNPAAASQVVLVEQTTARGPEYDPAARGAAADSLDPIVASGGTPVRGARVVISDARGDSVVAVEDAAARADGRGQGVYRFPTRAAGRGVTVAPGATYDLRVTATELGTARASTTVPAVFVAPDTGVRVVDAEQSLRIPTPGASGDPAALLLTNDSPEFAQFVIDDPAPSLLGYRTCTEGGGRVTNTARTFCFRLTYPGFTQRVTLAAVDSNYRSYLLGGRDPFGSVDRTSSIEGGVGVFGSTVLRARRTISVVSTVDRPIEGRFVAELRPENLPASLLLYSEEATGPAGVPAVGELWGNHQDASGRVVGGVTGFFNDSTVILTFLPGMRTSGGGRGFEARFSSATLRVLDANRVVQAVYRKR